MSEADLKQLIALREAAKEKPGVSEEALLELLTQALSRKERTLPVEETAALLFRRFEAFQLQYEFKVGQLVRWKKGLRHKRRPADGEPAIVIEVLDRPLLYDDRPDAGSPYFHEPLDLVLGVLDSDGDFVTFYFDKRRFEPYE